MVNGLGGETLIRHEVAQQADKMLQRIFSKFSMRSIDSLITVLQKVFFNSFKKVILNDT